MRGADSCVYVWVDGALVGYSGTPLPTAIAGAVTFIGRSAIPAATAYYLGELGQFRAIHGQAMDGRWVPSQGFV